MTSNADLYAHPQHVDDLLLAFPARLGDLLPPLEAIPADYPHREDWQRFQHAWFAGTLPDNYPIQAAAGVDVEAACRHLAAIQRSFEPKHEHKVAAVAWLASRWLVHATSNAERGD